MREIVAVVVTFAAFGCLPGKAVESKTSDEIALMLTDEAAQDDEAFSERQRTLAKLKDPAAVPSLVKGLNHDNVRVRFLAALGLRSLKHTESLEPLLKYVKEHSFEDDEELEKKAREGVMSEEQLTYEVHSLALAVETLGEIGDEKAIKAIVPLLGVKELNGVAEEAYVKIGGVELILKRKPKNIHEAQAWSSILTQIRDAKEIPVLMQIAADEEMDEQVRRGAMRGLGHMGAKEATDLFKRIANDRSEPRLVRAACFVSLAQTDPEKYTPSMEKSLPLEEDWLVRRAVARRLGQLRLKAATKLLMTMLEDPREDIQFVAADSLASCSGIRYEAVIEKDRVEMRWAPSEKLFPQGKVLVFTGSVAKDVKQTLEYRQRFGQ